MGDAHIGRELAADLIAQPQPGFRGGEARADAQRRVVLAVQAGFRAPLQDQAVAQQGVVLGFGDEGIVERQMYCEYPPRAEYVLTAKGHAARPEKDDSRMRSGRKLAKVCKVEIEGEDHTIFTFRCRTDFAAVLRALGVPGADFRIGLNAHDLAAAMGAPEVVLSRSRRDEGGPAIASRFLLRVQALLGELGDHHREADAPRLAAMIDHAAPAPDYPRPRPMPTAEQRMVAISVTGLDRLRADPYQFYASSILGLPELEPLEAEPSPAWQGTLAHEILETWHKTGRPLDEIARETLSAMHAHPLTRALWRPRLLNALRWVEASVASDPSRTPVLWEEKGRMEWRGVTLHGRIDRLDQLEDGTFAVVDYKTGKPPSGAQVERGFALQLGTLGLMVGEGAFAKAQGTASRFEYWSLGRSDKSDTGFGYITTPILEGAKKKGIAAGEFLPQARRYLDDALDNWILGSEPFIARLNPDAPSYATYDQLMRLDEWVGHEQ